MEKTKKERMDKKDWLCWFGGMLLIMAVFWVMIFSMFLLSSQANPPVLPFGWVGTLVGTFVVSAVISRILVVPFMHDMRLPPRSSSG